MVLLLTPTQVTSEAPSLCVAKAFPGAAVQSVCLHILLFSPSPQCCSQQHTLINWPSANHLRFYHLMWRADSLEKTLKLGKIEGRRRMVVTSDEMVGWHHQLSGHRFEQTPGDSEGQGSLACCSSWGCKELDMTATEQQQQKLICMQFPSL